MEGERLDAAADLQEPRPVERMVKNFQAELEEMHSKMRNTLKIDEPPPVILIWRPDGTDFQLFTWPVPWLH